MAAEIQGTVPSTDTGRSLLDPAVSGTRHQAPAEGGVSHLHSLCFIFPAIRCPVNLLASVG